jgi:hypothetical protein
MCVTGFASPTRHRRDASLGGLLCELVELVEAAARIRV